MTRGDPDRMWGKMLKSRDDLSDKERRSSKSSLIAYGLAEALRDVIVVK
jgi:hypothetical protein